MFEQASRLQSGSSVLCCSSLHGSLGRRVAAGTEVKCYPRLCKANCVAACLLRFQTKTSALLKFCSCMQGGHVNVYDLSERGGCLVQQVAVASTNQNDEGPVNSLCFHPIHEAVIYAAAGQAVAVVDLRAPGVVQTFSHSKDEINQVSAMMWCAQLTDSFSFKFVLARTRTWGCCHNFKGAPPILRLTVEPAICRLQ